MHGFIKFLVRGNMIGLAVGVVIGSLFSSLVESFVETFITPFISVIAGHSGTFSDMFWTFGKTKVEYGAFINSVITFVLIAAAMYFLVVLPVNRLATARTPHYDLSTAKRSCPACLSQIPAKASRCSFCCLDVTPITDVNSDLLIGSVPGEILLSSTAPSITLKPQDI